jgi:hypothetical protein
VTRRVHGTVGQAGTITEDGRLINDGALFAWRAGEYQVPADLSPAPLDVQIPLMGGVLTDGHGHDGAEVVGKLLMLWIPFEGLIYAEGITDVLEPGEYPCGLDLADLDMQLATTDGSPVDVDRAFAGEALEIIETVMRARVLGVTVYLPGSTARPSFDVAKLVVE